MCQPYIESATALSDYEYRKTGNVNEQVMLTNLTSGMRSLISTTSSILSLNHYYR